MNNEPIVVERMLNAPIANVWKAITDERDMKQWYFDLPGFKPEVGYEFQFTGGPDDRQYLHLCKVTEVVSGRKLVYCWRYDGYDGNSLVTFELFDQGDKTKIRLTHTGVETFPVGNPDFARTNFAEGWNHIINISLPEFLDKGNTK